MRSNISGLRIMRSNIGSMQIRDNRWPLPAHARVAQSDYWFFRSGRDSWQFSVNFTFVFWCLHIERLGQRRPIFTIHEPLLSSFSQLSTHLNCTLQIDRKDILRIVSAHDCKGAIESLSVKGLDTSRKAFKSLWVLGPTLLSKAYRVTNAV